MDSSETKIKSRDGGEFDCLIVAPEGSKKTPAIVLASAIHGVDEGLRGIAQDFASRGYLVAAPDLFWRTVPGPLKRDDPRSTPRGQPRLERIKAGENDLKDTLIALRRHPAYGGCAVAMGFCYGGPYAVLGPKRLGYDAGISCHGTQLLDYLGELEDVTKPVCFIWGDQDHAAPAPVLEAYRKVPEHKKNVEVHIFPGVQHGYMMRGSPAYDQKTYDFSMGRALALLEGLRQRLL
ncbi:MAG: dienelactone hydrolase family protein [Betaproteobacteria bacterium]